MQLIKMIHHNINRSVVVSLSLGVLAGCAGTYAQSPVPRDYVEIANPAVTMSPNAPETIWVPRSYVEKGVPRGKELVKQGYEAVTETATPTAPAPMAPMAPSPTAQQAGIVAPAGKPAVLIPNFGLVVAVDKEKIYFNLGREAGITAGQILKVHRGGTVIQGLGLAPGELIGTVEVQGFVGPKGGYGIIKQGGPVQTNDIVGVE
jgi:hypothetical protein